MHFLFLFWMMKMTDLESARDKKIEVKMADLADLAEEALGNGDLRSAYTFASKAVAMASRERKAGTQSYSGLAVLFIQIHTCSGSARGDDTGPYIS
jgi:hypothetical protein